jgi:hypothetical protein
MIVKANRAPVWVGKIQILFSVCRPSPSDKFVWTAIATGAGGEVLSADA